MPPPACPETHAACTLACLEIPAFPLQILLRNRPQWASAGDGSAAAIPVVVVDEDRPQGRVTHANAAARRAGIAPGQRYQHALGLAREVRAGVVPPGVVGAAVGHVLARLRAFSPNIEPSEHEPGVFWIDVSGLGGLYDTMLAWATEVLADLSREGFTVLAAIGFSRFGTYAGVKSLVFDTTTGGAGGGGERGISSQGPVRVMTQPEAERGLAMQVPLTYLAISAGVRERLERLGIQTLGELAALPEAGVMKRWGPEAHALHRLARGLERRDEAPSLPGLGAGRDVRLRPVPEVLPAGARVILDFLEHDAHRLLFRIKALLDGILAIVRERQALVAELHLDLGFDDGHVATHRFRPAAPTLDGALLVDLVRLRLESVDLGRGLVEIRLEASEVPANPEQMRLFKLGPHQDGAAAARALARVQAELGEDAVGTMSLRDAHLPRARQAFTPLFFDHDRIARTHEASAAPFARLAPHSGPAPAWGASCRRDHDRKSLPAPEAQGPPRTPPLIRRLHPHPEPLPPRPRDLRNDGWQPRDPTQGTIEAVHGPFVVAGGWWLSGAATRPGTLGEGSEVHREYAFVETRRGDLLWIYHDRRRRRWFEEGRIE